MLPCTVRKRWWSIVGPRPGTGRPRTGATPAPRSAECGPRHLGVVRPVVTNTPAAPRTPATLRPPTSPGPFGSPNGGSTRRSTDPILHPTGIGTITTPGAGCLTGDLARRPGATDATSVRGADPPLLGIGEPGIRRLGTVRFPRHRGSRPPPLALQNPPQHGQLQQ